MRSLDCQVLVIGSGPGGATTAALLCEAGFEVLLVEEGGNWSIDSSPSYSLTEMDQKYRSGGLTSTFGKTPVTYIAGRCVGGASEINAALYHRPKAETLEAWAVKNQLDDFELADLEPHFEAIERDFSVSSRPMGVSPASRLLEKGAVSKGWKSHEVERFWKYTENADGTFTERRQSMTETMIPRALAAGCRLMPDTRIRHLEVHGNAATAAVGTTLVEGRREPLRITFEHVFVCCGAVQTPALLRRSGITQNIGDSLNLHPMVRVAARFPEAVNDPHWGVPTQQVEQFKPHITLGCSHSSKPHIAMWLNNTVPDQQAVLDQPERTAVFYTAIQGQSKGTVRNVPFFDEPFVYHPLGRKDMALIGEGLYRLGQLLFAAGATEIYNPLPDGPVLRTERDLGMLRTALPHGKLSVSTIHLFSSCPMGQDHTRCAVDSHGRLHGFTNIQLHDASILPSSPGVNPQGIILTLARRNTLRWLENHA